MEETTVFFITINWKKNIQAEYPVVVSVVVVFDDRAMTIATFT
jgi:hypothetical protein